MLGKHSPQPGEKRRGETSGKIISLCSILKAGDQMISQIVESGEGLAGFVKDRMFVLNILGVAQRFQGVYLGFGNGGVESFLKDFFIWRCLFGSHLDRSGR